MTASHCRASLDAANASRAQAQRGAAAVRKSAGDRVRTNQAAQQMLRAGLIQAKPSIGQPGDRFEQEADRVAETVMRSPAPALTQPGSRSHAITVQRLCTECEDEMQRKPASAVASVGDGFQHPRSGGQPLPDAERSFFEPRFNHDFSRVRLHTGSQAATAARSVDALAYTMGSDIVFGESQYRPGTDGGRRLLAHELTHVVQQGAANAPAVQRLGDPNQAPQMICPIAQSTAAFVETDVLFPLDSSALTAVAILDIASFISRWRAAGATKMVRIDGYASTDGAEPRNWILSCDRALMVEAELMTPSLGGPGIPAGLIEMFAQGETSEFGAALPPNRRATIASDIAPPVCANPGVERIIDLQPVFLRTDPADASPTGTSWARRFSETNAIWNKVGVTFTEHAAITLDTALKSTGATEAEANAVAALRAGAGIEVFLVDNDMAVSGGASTAAGCGAAGNIVMSDRGTSDTLLAHELCHTMQIDHPGGANPGEAGTIAEPSDSHSVDNSRRNTLTNFAAILCPPATATTCIHPDP